MVLSVAALISTRKILYTKLKRSVAHTVNLRNAPQGCRRPALCHNRRALQTPPISTASSRSTRFAVWILPTVRTNGVNLRDVRLPRPLQHLHQRVAVKSATRAAARLNDSSQPLWQR